MRLADYAEDEALKDLTSPADAMRYDWDLRTGVIIRSRGIKDITGVPLKGDDPTLRWWLKRIHSDDRRCFLETLRRAKRERVSQFEARYRIRCERDGTGSGIIGGNYGDGNDRDGNGDGGYRWVRDRARVLYDKQRRFVSVWGSVSDIDAEERELQKLRIEMDQARAAIERMQVALRETNHRVKNHLQAISALAQLAATRAEFSTGAAQEDLNRISRHAQSMASLHELLSASEPSRIDSTCSNSVIERLAPMLQSISSGRRMEYRCAEFSLTPKQNSALCLILVELVSNCLKHGDGPIHISIQSCKAKGGGCRHARLVVADGGAGFPVNFDAQTDARLGIQLLMNLTRHDLQGTIQFGSRKRRSACVLASFPLTVGQPSAVNGRVFANRLPDASNAC